MRKKKDLAKYEKIKYFLNMIADTLLINTLDLTNETDKGNVRVLTRKYSDKPKNAVAPMLG